jgi:mono/diheme cytochrome c family protein
MTQSNTQAHTVYSRVKRPLGFLIRLGVLGLPAAAILFATQAMAQEAKIDFAHDVLPILKARCAECHTSGTYKGSFSLDSRAELLKSGVVEAGNSADSELLRRLMSSDLDERMPPKGDPLLPEQISKLKAWIDSGIEWPAELAFRKAQFEAPLKIVKPELPVTTDSTHPIDRFVSVYFAEQKIAAPTYLDDAAFLRRIKMDLIGLLPTGEELGPFTENRSADKYEVLADALLAQKHEYAKHWMTFWNDLLRNDYVGTGYIDGGRTQITTWLYQSLVQNKPYDQFVRELIDPQPESAGFIKGIKWRGRVNASQIEQLQFSQNISQVFLGINMKCASCHDSFIDDWKLEDAYGLAAVITDTPLEIHRCDQPIGEIAKPKFVFAELGEIDQNAPRDERLKQLSLLMTSPDNGRFARTIVNRLWQRLLGRGIVHPVDIMTNRPWSPELLDYLAADLIEHQYDLKRTLKLIVTSDIYRRESLSQDESEIAASDFVFRGTQSKRLTAEQFVDAIWRLADIMPAQFDAKIQPSTPLAAQWIWHDANAGAGAPAGDQIAVRKVFRVEGDVRKVVSVTVCDNQYRMWLNGKPISSSNQWSDVRSVDFTEQLRQGDNEILIDCKNLGDGPNPAGLILQAVLMDETGVKQTVVSDNSWQWTRQIPDEQGKFAEANIEWKPAAVLAKQDFLGADLQNRVAAQFANAGEDAVGPARAALVQSDALMRSLGRPNREQVVTTRPEQLSTLQALDLTNGPEMTELISRAAAKIQPKFVDQSPDQIANALFLETVSRQPTAEERQIAAEILTTEKSKEAFEDLLWIIFMLPEFQLIR